MVINGLCVDEFLAAFERGELNPYKRNEAKGGPPDTLMIMNHRQLKPNNRGIYDTGALRADIFVAVNAC